MESSPVNHSCSGKLSRKALFFGLALLVTLGCALPSAVATRQPAAQVPVDTIVAATWSAMQTQEALSATPTFTLAPGGIPSQTAGATQTAEPNTQPQTPGATFSPTPTWTLIPPLTSVVPPPSITPLPSLTPVPTATNTRVPAATNPPSSSTKTPTGIPCNLAKLVRHITIPNGSYIPPGAAFTKVWRIRNIGSCEWYTQYYFINVVGDPLGGAPLQLTTRVKPNQEIDIAIPMVAPLTPGNYKGGWALRVGTYLFGDYSNDNSPFVVEINVGSPPSGVIFSFVNSACSAQWVSNAGILPCPGKIGARNGFIRPLNEVDSEENFYFEPTLWTQPALTPGGYIYGAFPGLPIFAGDRFRAKLGCMDGATACQVKFSLYVQPLGGTKVLVASWTEVYDGILSDIDLDLSAFAHPALSFTLLVEDVGNTSASVQSARAIWINPILYRP